MKTAGTGTEQARFRNNATNNLDHIQLGADNKESLKNAVTFYSEFLDNAFAVNNFPNTLWGYSHLEYERDGLDLVIRSKQFGNPIDLRGDLFSFAETVAGATFDSTTMNNGQNQGLDTTGVVNKDFIGTLQGFETEFLSNNEINASITVGEATYSAHVTDTNPTALTRVRFLSDSHGYFDVDMAAGGGMNVTNQADAKSFARELDIAFGTKTFYQERTLTNFAPHQGSDLFESRFVVKREDFSAPLVVEDFSVTAVDDSNTGFGQLSITINGETYTSHKELDRGVEPYAKIEMFSELDGNRSVTFVNDDGDFDIVTTEDAQAFEDEVLEFMPLGTIEDGVFRLDFQAGEQSTQVISVYAVDATTDNLFRSQSLNILTEESATIASAAVLGAIDAVTAMRAEVGSIQSRTDFANANLTSAITNQDAARARLVDTNIAEESTLFASTLVRVEANIALIAQGNRLQSEFVSGVYDPQLNNLEASLG